MGKPCALFAMILCLASAGCVQSFAKEYRDAGYRSAARGYDIETHWTTARDGSMLVTTGYMKVVRYMEIGKLQIDAEAKDAEGATVGRASVLTFPDRLGQYDTVPFVIRIPLASGVTAARIRFYYTYEIHDDRYETGWGDFEELLGP